MEYRSFQRHLTRPKLPSNVDVWLSAASSALPLRALRRFCSHPFWYGTFLHSRRCRPKSTKIWLECSQRQRHEVRGTLKTLSTTHLFHIQRKSVRKVTRSYFKREQLTLCNICVHNLVCSSKLYPFLPLLDINTSSLQKEEFHVQFVGSIQCCVQRHWWRRSRCHHS